MTKLTNKQKSFVNHYLITLNATEAAERAGYKGNRATLSAVGYENLRKPQVRKEIDARLSELTMTADEALVRMTHIARGDLSRYVSKDGSLDIELLKADGVGHILKKYKRNKSTSYSDDGQPFESETIEIELYPADSALERIMRYHGVYKDTTNHDGEITIRYVNDWRGK